MKFSPLAVCLFCLSAAAPAAALTIQDGLNGYAGTHDTYLSFGNANHNYGDYDYLRIKWDNNSQNQKDMNTLLVFQSLRYDQGVIPNHKIITAASLTLRYYNDDMTADEYIGITPYRLTAPWNEGAGGEDVTANYVYRQDAVNWTNNAGGWNNKADDGNSTNYIQHANGTFVGPIKPGNPVSFNVINSVSNWYLGQADNLGFILGATYYNQEHVLAGGYFRSKDYATTPSERPKLDVTYSAATMTWNKLSATWDTNTSPLNWTWGGGDTYYIAGDKVRFDDTGGSGTATVTVAGGGVSPASLEFANSGAKSYIFQGGAIGGGTDLLKNGAGSITLSVANTYSGTTTLNAGSIIVGHASALGSASSDVLVGELTDGGNPAALLVNTAFTLSRNINVRSGSSGAATLGGTNSTGTAVFSGGVTLNKAALLTAESGGEVDFTGLITGSGGGFTKVGPGTVKLTHANSYTGTSAVNAGSLVLTNATALGSDSSAVLVGETASNGNAAALLAGSAVSLNRDVTVRLGSSGAATIGGSNTSGMASFPGTITLNKSVQLTAASGGMVDFSGLVTGVGGITKNGLGKVYLDSANSFQGDTTINAGSLYIVDGGSLGTATSAVAVGETADNGNPASLLACAPLTFARNISVRAGSSGLATFGEANSGGTVTCSGSVTLNKSAQLTADSGDQVDFTGLIGGSGGITKIGEGTVRLTRANTYSGQTAISGGTVLVAAAAPNNADGALGHASSAVLVGYAGGTGSLLIDGAYTIGRPINVQNGGTILGSRAAGAEMSGVVTLDQTATFFADSGASLLVSGQVTGAGGLTKAGSGVVTTAGPGTNYGGVTNVNQGTLQMTTAAGIPGDCNVQGGAQLTGAGKIAGHLIVAASGLVSPGSSPGTLQIGTQSLPNQMTFLPGATYTCELTGSGPGQCDLLDVFGNISVGGATLDPRLGYKPTTGDLLTIISNEGDNPVGGAFLGYLEGYQFQLKQSGSGEKYTFQITYLGGDGNDVVIKALTPEPATLALLAMGVLAAMARRRRLAKR